jgi:hypothetical protein
MIENLPKAISVLFGLTTLATLLIFYRAVKNSSSSFIRSKAARVLAGLMIWLLIQALITGYGVYKASTTSMPPKILLMGVLPTVVIITLLFVTRKGHQFIDSLPLTTMTYLHVVRVAVELIFIALLTHKAIPQLMTFEGRNFDILTGSTAPFIAYWGLAKGRLSQPVILLWNGVGLALLINIVVNALLSTPSPIQRFAFDQPNWAILYFPFSWLPTFIVPIVLFGHLTAIRRLINKGRAAISTPHLVAE